MSRTSPPQCQWYGCGLTVNAQPALLIGLGENAAELHSDLQTAIQDQLEAGSAVTSAPNGVIVGGGLGVAKGEPFEVGSTQFTAVAVVDGAAARRLNDAHFVIAPLALAQQISGRGQRLDSILVFTKPDVDVAIVRAAVTTALQGRAVVATPSFRAAQASSSFAILQAMTLLAASVSLVVAAFLSYNAMSIAIAQRRPVISTMRALGGRRRTIMSDMLAEAALVGFLGGVIGSALGVVIGYFAIGELPSTMVQTLDARLEYVLPTWVVPLAVAACVTASVIASALAARQIHGVAPIEALAPNGAATSGSGSRRLRIIAGIAGATLLAVTIVVVTADLGQIAIASIALAFIGFSALCFAFSVPIIKAAAAVARRFGPAGVLGAATIERAPRRMWVAMMTVLTAVVTTVAVTGATSNAVDSTVASFASIAKADVWVSSAAATDYSSALLPPDTAATVAAVPGVERVVADQMAFATVGDTRVMLLGIAAESHRDIYTSLAPRDRQKLLAGEGVALSRDLGQSMKVDCGRSDHVADSHRSAHRAGARTGPVLLRDDGHRCDESRRDAGLVRAPGSQRPGGHRRCRRRPGRGRGGDPQGRLPRDVRLLGRRGAGRRGKRAGSGDRRHHHHRVDRRRGFRRDTAEYADAVGPGPPPRDRRATGRSVRPGHSR